MNQASFVLPVPDCPLTRSLPRSFFPVPGSRLTSSLRPHITTGRAKWDLHPDPIGVLPMFGRVVLLALSLGIVSGCDAGPPSVPPPVLSARTSSPPSPSPARSVPPSRVTPLAADCPQPAVALITRPGNWSRAPRVPWVEAAFRAHPEFKLVGSRPTEPMAVHLESYPKRQKDDSDEPRYHMIVARCADANTCNQVATMFASVVPSSEPQTTCGATVPGTYGTGTPATMYETSDDPWHRCARLTVCLRKAGRWTDLGPACEKAEASLLACAKRDTCDAIEACVAAR